MNPCIRFHKCADVLPAFSTAVPPDVRKVSDFALPTFRLMGLRPALRAQPAAGLTLLAEGSAFPHISWRSRRLWKRDRTNETPQG